MKYYVKSKKQFGKRTILSILIFVISFFVPILFIKGKIFDIQTEDALVGVVSIVVTALSAVFVVFQLKDSENVTCCNMLSEMNLSFIQNPRLMLLYQKLEECYRNPKKELEVVDDDDDRHIHTSDLVAYFTFFEVLNEYVKHKIVTIPQLDDLFGYRFFIFVHNRYIQERELFAVPSSYVNIFQLYDKWIEYRKINITDKHCRLVIMQENQIPDYYLKNKTYLQERLYSAYISQQIKLKGKEEKIFEIKSLLPSDLRNILQLQDEVVTSLEDKKIFQPSTEEEILESMLVDACFGLYFDNQLVAFSLMVFNRKSKRNLCIDWECLKKDEPYWDYLTFDSIQVLPEYRGYGIQCFFLSIAEKVASNVRAKYIVATVSPDNTFSLTNFETNGYERHSQKNPYFKYGSDRILLRKQVEI